MALGFGGTASSRSIHHMNQAKSAMDKSLLKISSGSRLVSPGDDPGGIAVAMKLRSSIATNDAAKLRVENAKSYVEMQSSTLESASDIITEMQGLKESYNNPLASASEKSSYASQFDELRSQLVGLGSNSINGQNLFANGDLDVATNSTGSGVVTLENIDYSNAIAGANFAITDAGLDLDGALDAITSELGKTGSDLSSLGFASDYLSSTATNLESALGRIEDVDLAAETTNHAALTLRYEAAAAAVAQANASADTVFNLLMGSLGKD